jgi:glutathione S-transferase
MVEVLRLYDFGDSGNAYKVRLLLSQLGIPFERVVLDPRKGETKRPEYLAKNAYGRVPMVEWPDGRRLTESNAILWFLAQGTRYLPDDRWDRACVLQWMFFEQNGHEPFLAVVRNWYRSGIIEAKRAELPSRMERGREALGVMDKHLAGHAFFVREAYTIADIALYAYTHCAADGGFDLDPYPAVRAWLERVRSQPGHVPLEAQVGRAVAWP